MRFIHLAVLTNQGSRFDSTCLENAADLSLRPGPSHLALRAPDLRVLELGLLELRFPLGRLARLRGRGQVLPMVHLGKFCCGVSENWLSQTNCLIAFDGITKREL